tara:strand:+ start:300 stop:2423 length:2124 start_codon:yes stop_codon:yes gene_type:complete
MKISILLPYKENFSPNYAGAVSLFVNDINKKSKFKKNIYVFGSMNFKENLSNKYVNLKFNRKFYESSSALYVKTFLKHEKKLNSDIIEVHNRPNYIKQISEVYTGKVILFFHNDPLSMNGSKSLVDRKFLINKLDLLVFNSNWSKKRFFIGFNDSNLYEKKIIVCYQSAPKTKINFNKKEKLISFVGKLNSAKGYDIFGQAICKILDNHKDWKALVIGDEPRENLFYYHKNLELLGFKKNDFILNTLKKVSVSIICSRWNEPFGRASLEASSRGSAVIISNRGGLPETSKDAIILKTLNVDILYKTISNLIKDKKKLLKTQKKIYSSFILTHEYVAKIIDDIREKIYETQFNNSTLVKKNLPIKILHITNFNYRFTGRLHYNTGKRINNGFIRLGHNVLSISDRDIVHNNKKFNDPLGFNFLQKYVLEAYENFKPNIIVLGHADNVNLETLLTLKSKNKNLKIAQWFLDPLGKNGPDYLRNKKRILDKHAVIDATFLTSDPKSLDFKISNSYFIPNPCDPSFDYLENYNYSTSKDIFFAMSHGVHRGQLKIGKSDNREIFINKLIKKNNKVNFDIYGMNNVQPIWGAEFMEKISNSAMGLNLSRGKPVKYYSSDRIAQLMGNGLLTFIDKDTFYDDYFNENQLIFYKGIDDLSYKINKYKRDEKDRKRIAKNGKNFYFKHFNSNIVARFILNKTLILKHNNGFLWEK